MSWTIQRIEPSEAARLVPLLKRLHALHAEARPDMFRADSSPDELRKLLEEMLGDQAMTGLVAVGPDGSILGYAIFEVERREATALNVERRWGMLHHIAVEAGRRREGIGTALIEATRTRLRMEGIARMRTNYWTFNHASAALMRKAGFAPDHVYAEAAV